MKKLIAPIIFIMIYNHVVQTAALIPPHVSTKLSKSTKVASEKIIGQPLTKKFTEYAQVGKNWWDKYWINFLRPTHNELKVHGLWYGLKSGTARSLYGQDPLKGITDYYAFLKNSWQETLSPTEFYTYQDVINNYNKAYAHYLSYKDHATQKLAEIELFKATKKLFDAMHEQQQLKKNRDIKINFQNRPSYRYSYPLDRSEKQKRFFKEQEQKGLIKKIPKLEIVHLESY